MIRTLIPLIALAFATQAQGQAASQPLEVVGYAGDLGEWELTGKLTERAALGSTEFAGPILMRHSGICSVLGPEEKTGEIRLQQSGSRVEATLLVDSEACRYSGKLGEFYSGAMSCPGRPMIPLKLWLR